MEGLARLHPYRRRFVIGRKAWRCLGAYHDIPHWQAEGYGWTQNDAEAFCLLALHRDRDRIKAQDDFLKNLAQ